MNQPKSVLCAQIAVSSVALLSLIFKGPVENRNSVCVHKRLGKAGQWNISKILIEFLFQHGIQISHQKTAAEV